MKASNQGHHSSAPRASAPPRKTAISIARRAAPETRTGAFPDRLGSPGTAKVPHSAAAPRTRTVAAAHPIGPGPAARRAHAPTAMSDPTSSPKRRLRTHGAITGGALGGGDSLIAG